MKLLYQSVCLVLFVVGAALPAGVAAQRILYVDAEASGANDGTGPIATGGSGCSRKKATASASVSSGVRVGKRVRARTSSGPVPRAQTNFVPPASMPP